MNDYEIKELIKAKLACLKDWSDQVIHSHEYLTDDRIPKHGTSGLLGLELNIEPIDKITAWFSNQVQRPLAERVRDAKADLAGMIEDTREDRKTGTELLMQVVKLCVALDLCFVNLNNPERSTAGEFRAAGSIFITLHSQFSQEISIINQKFIDTVRDPEAASELSNVKQIVDKIVEKLDIVSERVSNIHKDPMVEYQFFGIQEKLDDLVQGVAEIQDNIAIRSSDSESKRSGKISPDTPKNSALDDTWLTNKETAELLNRSPGFVSQLCSGGHPALLSKGNGRNRRISLLSASAYKMRKEKEELDERVHKLGIDAIKDAEEIARDEEEMNMRDDFV